MVSVFDLIYFLPLIGSFLFQRLFNKLLVVASDVSFFKTPFDFFLFIIVFLLRCLLHVSKTKDLCVTKTMSNNNNKYKTRSDAR